MWESLVPQTLFDSGDQQDLFATWTPGGGQRTESWVTGPAQTYLGSYGDYWDDGTDSDTASGNGHEELPEPGVRTMTDAEAAEHIYMHYQRVNMTLRRFTEKRSRVPMCHPTRGRYVAKEKEIKNRGFFFTHDDVMVYLKGNGK